MTVPTLGSPIGHFNTLRLEQNDRQFEHDNLKCILLSENVWISTTISLKFVADDSVNNLAASCNGAIGYTWTSNVRDWLNCSLS